MSIANELTFKSLLKKPVYLLAFGFGAGLSPKAPGTVGTLVGIPIYFLLYSQSTIVYISIISILFLLGIYLCSNTARELGVHDYKGIVWDEVVGYLITMIAVPFSYLNILLGFILFRIFDILKPWPISWCDRKIKGGLGIMLDDVLAGIMAMIILNIFVTFIS